MRRRLVVLVAVVAMVASACTGESGSQPISSPRDRLAGGTLHVGVDASNGWYGCPLFCGGQFDPMSILAPAIGELMRCCLQRTLLSFRGATVSEGGGILRPDLATSLPTISSDGLTWTFTIRPGIHYAPPLQDHEVTSQDFVRSFTRALTPPGPEVTFFEIIGGYITDTYLKDEIAGAQAYIDGSADRVSGLEAPDARTFRIHLTRPVGDLGYRVAWNALGPIPPNPARPSDLLGIAQGHDGDFGDFMVSTGPYMFAGSEELDLSAPAEDQVPPVGDGFGSMTLVRNPSWSSADDPLRPAYPDRIVVTPIEDGSAMEELLRSGALDVALNWNADQPVVDAWRSDPSLRDRMFVEPADAVNYIGINLAVPPLDDLHVRRAMNYAVDRQAVAEATGRAGGNVVPATHIGLDSLEDNLLLSYDHYGFTGNLAAARREMALSAYDSDGDGVCDADVCRSIGLVVHGDRPEDVAAALVVAADFRSVGLHVHLERVSGDRYGEFYGDPSAHVALIYTGWIKDILSASSFFSTLFVSATVDRGNLSMVGATVATLRHFGYAPVSIPNVDPLLASCEHQAFEAQTHCWASVDQDLTENVVPWIPLTQQQSAWAVGPRVRHFTVDISQPSPLPALDQIVLSGPQASPSPTSVPGHNPGIPDGVYRVEVHPKDLLARAPYAAPDDVDQTTGTLTLVVRGDEYWLRLVGRVPVFAPFTVGVLQGSGDRVTFESRGPSDHPPPISMRWSLQGTTLRFSHVDCRAFRPPDPFGCAITQTWFSTQPWGQVATIPAA